MSQITLKQIAERAGTSVGTVDRALNNRGRISPSTKEKIIKISCGRMKFPQEILLY